MSYQTLGAPPAHSGFGYSVPAPAGAYAGGYYPRRRRRFARTRTIVKRYVGTSQRYIKRNYRFQKTFFGLTLNAWALLLVSVFVYFKFINK
jgi:hypothetical protein